MYVDYKNGLNFLRKSPASNSAIVVARIESWFHE